MIDSQGKSSSIVIRFNNGNRLLIHSQRALTATPTHSVRHSLPITSVDSSSLKFSRVVLVVVPRQVTYGGRKDKEQTNRAKSAKLNKQSKDVLVQCVRFSAPAPLIEPSIELIPLTMSSKWYPIAMNGPRNMFTPTKSEGCEGCGVRRGMRKTQICNYCAFCINIQIYSMWRLFRKSHLSPNASCIANE